MATIFLALTTIAGALTTSAGPLAGDQSISHPVKRLHYPIINLLGFHTVCVLAYIVLVITIFLYCFQHVDTYRDITKVITYILIVAGVQILIGVLQTIFSLPGYLVVFHVLGACINVALLGYFSARIKLIAT